MERFEEKLMEMGKRADKVIATWSFAGLTVNLLPPPFDSMAVATSMAKMGWEIAKIYEVEMSFQEVKRLGIMLAKGLGAVASAAYIGTGIFKYIPGVNVWVALLVQPPMVGAISFAAGKAYKSYFETILKGKDALTDEEFRRIAEGAFKSKARFVK